MQWDLLSCLERFEQLAATMFLSKEQKGKVSFSQKVQQIFHAWLNDHRYNLSPIERAFQSNSFAKMFNPLQNDTKVAVTATSVRANVPCIIANYNGGPRSDDSSTFMYFLNCICRLTKSRLFPYSRSPLLPRHDYQRCVGIIEIYYCLPVN